jgi:hypothetical protein
VSEQTPENDIEPDDVDTGAPDVDEDEGAEEKPYKPPTKGEWDRLQRRIAKLTKAGKPVASVDQQLAAQLAGAKDEKDEAPAAQNDHWRNVAIQNAAAAQISAAGFSGSAKQAARLAKLIDTAGLEPDRHGSFDLEDEIEDLKEEYPMLFSAEAGRRNPRVRTAPSPDKVPAKDPTAATSAKMMRQAGY